MIDDHPSKPTETADESEFYQHDNWQAGQRCPDCGHEYMYVTQASNETYQHADGDYEHVDWGAYRENLHVTCKNCGTVLLRHPAMNILNAV